MLIHIFSPRSMAILLPATLCLCLSSSLTTANDSTASSAEHKASQFQIFAAGDIAKPSPAPEAPSPQADINAKALQFFERAIAAGDVKAQRLLGETLISGEGLPKDVEKGRSLLEAAAKTDTQAQVSLGKLYLSGEDLPKDTERALELLERAAKSGDATALDIMGMSYLTGENLPHDPEKGRAYLERGIKAGSRTAQRHLAEALIRGEGIPENKAEGIALLTEAAERDPLAQLALGRMYFSGIDVEKDVSKALPLLEKAAAAGKSSALAQLGLEYLTGRDAQLDSEAAEAYLRQAMAAGNAGAARILAIALIQGRVLTKNADEGLQILQRASDRGDQDAALLMGQVYLRGEDVPQDLKRATEIFENLAANGNGQGLEALGNSYLWGDYTPSRPEVAEELLSRAADLGRQNVWSLLANAAASGRLGRQSTSRFDEFAKKARLSDDERIDVYEAERQLRGAGVPQNLKKGLAQLESAASSGNTRAIAHLIRLYRDGRRKLIGRNPKKAAAYLQSYSEELSKEDLRLQEFLLEIADARSTASFERLLNDPANEVILYDYSAQDDILRANANFAVYRLQKALIRQGYYSGPTNGLLTSATIRAMQNACKTLSIADQCRQRVMTRDVFTRLTLGWTFSMQDY